MDAQYQYGAQELRDEQYERDYQQHLKERAMFWEQHNKIIRLRREDLQAGDVILFQHESIELDADHRLLQPARHSQGYYRYDLVGGQRYAQFLRTPETVATWNGRCWHWNR